ncbi:hypothetical protein ACT410_05825 [Acinetobacter baumannii]
MESEGHQLLTMVSQLQIRITVQELRMVCITVDIADSGTGLISGTTGDVAPNSNVVLTIKGKDATGADVEITRTVQNRC